jgi:hypothetical protein
MLPHLSPTLGKHSRTDHLMPPPTTSLPLSTLPRSDGDEPVQHKRRHIDSFPGGKGALEAIIKCAIGGDDVALSPAVAADVVEIVSNKH